MATSQTALLIAQNNLRITNALKKRLIDGVTKSGTIAHGPDGMLGYVLEHLVTEKIPFQLTWTPRDSFVRVTGGEK